MRVEQVKRVLSERLLDHVWGPVGTCEKVEALIASGEAPYDVAERLLGALVDDSRTSGTARTGGHAR